MTISYSLTSEKEPSDKQLDDLMKAVLQDVKERAEKADALFAQHQKDLLQTVLSKYKRKSND